MPQETRPPSQWLAARACALPPRPEGRGFSRFLVMVEKQAEFVTGAWSGTPPAKIRVSASAQTLASWLAMCPALGCVVALESPRTWTLGATVLE